VTEWVFSQRKGHDRNLTSHTLILSPHTLTDCEGMKSSNSLQLIAYKAYSAVGRNTDNSQRVCELSVFLPTALYAL
jgi:hypothetical protein